MMRALLAGTVALAVTLLVEPPLIRLLQRRQLLDLPNHRSSHEQPTLRGGGIAVVAAATVGGLVGSHDRTMMWMIGGVLCFGLLGLVEDLAGIRVASRLGLQVVLALVLAVAACRGAGYPAGWLVLALAAASVFIVAVVNAVNFMDGINGISGLQALVGGIAYGLLGRHLGVSAIRDLGSALAGVGLGFLPFNIPRARVFLGDVGSYAIGAGLASLAVAVGIAGVPIEAAVAPLAVYLSDTGWTLLTRIRRGESWYEPHRNHVYQRLTDLGMSHVAVAVTVSVVSAAVAALGAVSLIDNLTARVLADGAAAVLLVSYLAAPLLLRRTARAERPAVGSDATEAATQVSTR